MGTCPDSIKRLVDQFTTQADQLRASDYNETQVRIDYLNPLFRALGWDIDNAQGYAEQYREVVHEDRVKVAKLTKAPDYSFRVGGVRKFFLEAKKPFVKVKTDVEPAYQLRRYGWSAKLAVSLLSDFEEFAIYDCRVQPKLLDKASTARRDYFKYTEYEAKWDFLEATFSKTAVLTGAFDRYCDTKRGRGASEFDEAFLVEIESWRQKLANNIALRNDGLDGPALNFAVQRIIDRIIFLRMAEDRGTEEPRQLEALLTGDDTYARLQRLFRAADARYNSGLFHFAKEQDRDEAPDALTPSLSIDDAALKAIVKRLYYPESPYEFTVVSADILGSVYERFLGKVITLSPAGRARIEEKPEVRKAGGVYYTPTYIVDYIVRNTIGRLLLPLPPGEGRGDPASHGEPTPFAPNVVPGPTHPHPSPLPEGEGTKPAAAAALRSAARLKVLDPACGSGSFLIGAYQYLLDWYLQQYAATDPAARAAGKRPVLRPGPDGAWRLTIAERKRILLDHIHGVDLDAAAVEVTKLNLLLKCLEGETSQTLGFEQRLFRERALPDLGQNILCGNSLIGTDIIGTDAWNAMNDEERAKVNPFDYERAFPEVFKGKGGGFDAVIGNPPYVRQESIKEIKSYLETRYEAFDSTADLYVFFIERGGRALNERGLLSFIVSSSFLKANFGKGLRELLRSKYPISSLVDFGGLGVFEDAKDTYVCIPTISKLKSNEDLSTVVLRELPHGTGVPISRAEWYSVPRIQLSPEEWRLDPPHVEHLYQRLKVLGMPLGQLVNSRIFLGIKTGLNEAFELTEVQRNELLKDPTSSELVHLFVGGQDIRRYVTEGESRYLIGVPAGFTRATYFENSRDISENDAWSAFAKAHPSVGKHLAPFAAVARKRTDKGDFWWELRPCDYYSLMSGRKIIYPDITKGPRFVLDAGTWIRNTAYCLDSDSKPLLGVLNSKLAWWLVARVSIPFGTRAGEYRYRLFTQYMSQIPICALDASADGAARLTALVSTMLALHKKLAAEKVPQRREQVEREIGATDRQIDAVVYGLYGLTTDEIAIVEAATR